LINNIIDHSLNYLEKNEYKSFDYFDALSSPLLNNFSNQLIRRISIQLIGKSIINIRPLLGIKRKLHTKLISDLLSIYSKLYNTRNEEIYLRKAYSIYDILITRGIKSNDKIAWGLNFPYSSRFVDSNENTPNIFNTLNSVISLLDFYKVTNDENIIIHVKSSLNYIFEDLGLVEITRNCKWLRYYPGQTIPTYNVNAMAAYVFAMVNNIYKNEIVSLETIDSLINFLLDGQNKNGSWFYSESKNGKWIDGFHSGYIIESLSYMNINEILHDDSFQKSVSYYIDNLFTNEGIPKYYNNKIYPIESQNCAQAIQTISKLIMNHKFDYFILLENIIDNVIKHLYNSNGYFYYKKEKYFTNKNIFFRWSISPMLLALLFAQEALAKKK
jgi:hypothetical protein